MSQKLTCIITGKTITVGNEYFEKKVSQYGTEEKLRNLYVSRQVKSLLKRGYKINEIKNLLKISDENSLDISDKMVKDILKINDDETAIYENISIKKSDPEVIEYINSIRSYLA